MSLEARASVYEYVQCIETKYWKNTPERADLGYRVAKCVIEGLSLRRCSTIHWGKRYPRLERYTRQLFLEGSHPHWILLGKLLEVAVYVYYESHRRPSLSRHLELRAFVKAPLDTWCHLLLEDYDSYEMAYMISGYIRAYDEKMADFIDNVLSQGAEAVYGIDDLPEGCREIDSYTLPCTREVRGEWCNYVYKVGLYGTSPVIIGATVYILEEKRFYVYDPPCLVARKGAKAVKRYGGRLLGRKA